MKIINKLVSKSDDKLLKNLQTLKRSDFISNFMQLNKTNTFVRSVCNQKNQHRHNYYNKIS